MTGEAAHAHVPGLCDLFQLLALSLVSRRVRPVIGPVAVALLAQELGHHLPRGPLAEELSHPGAGAAQVGQVVDERGALGAEQLGALRPGALLVGRDHPAHGQCRARVVPLDHPPRARVALEEEVVEGLGVDEDVAQVRGLELGDAPQHELGLGRAQAQQAHVEGAQGRPGLGQALLEQARHEAAIDAAGADEDGLVVVPVLGEVPQLDRHRAPVAGGADAGQGRQDEGRGEEEGGHRASGGEGPEAGQRLAQDRSIHGDRELRLPRREADSRPYRPLREGVLMGSGGSAGRTPGAPSAPKGLPRQVQATLRDRQDEGRDRAGREA